MSRQMQFDIVANDKASGTLRGVQSAVAELGKKIAGFFTVSALFDRALGMVQQGFSALMQTLKDTAALNDQAKAAGLTTAELQRLGIAAAEAGLDQQGLMKGLKTMKEFLRDARVEGSKQAEVLIALGYSQDQITSGSIDAMGALLRLSGAVEAAQTSQDKYNVAASVFGTRAQELIPLLDGLRNAIAAAAGEPIVSEQTINNLDKAEKKIDRMIRMMKVLISETASFATTDVGSQSIASHAGPLGGFSAMIANIIMRVGDRRQPAVPVNQKDKAVAETLGKIGMTSATGGTALGMNGVTSAQSLGMAASIALAQQQTAYLATIAANTGPQSMGGRPGSTNFTKRDATASELAATYQNIRYTTSPASKVRPAR